MQPFICLLFVSLQAAKLPMSIIIVGVGQAEFDGTVKFFMFQTESSAPLWQQRWKIMTANVFESVGRAKRWWTLTQTEESAEVKYRAAVFRAHSYKLHTGGNKRLIWLSVFMLPKWNKDGVCEVMFAYVLLCIGEFVWTCVFQLWWSWMGTTSGSHPGESLPRET